MCPILSIYSTWHDCWDLMEQCLERQMFYLPLRWSPPSLYKGAYRNLILLSTTTVMEIILVCFLLSTLGRLPYQLEGKECRDYPVGA